VGGTGAGTLRKPAAEAPVPAPASVKKVRNPKRRNGRQVRAAWMFSLPFLLLYLVFEVGPVLASLGMSLTDMRSTDVTDPLAVEVTGLDNYERMLHDDQLQQAMFNTGYFVVVGVPLTLLCGLAVAVALNSGVTRMQTLFRVGYYLPVVSSTVAVSVIWLFVLNGNSGLLNEVLGKVGIDGRDWLHDDFWAMPSIIALAVWRNLGFQMVVFLAGLQAIPAHLYEAAKMDGAGKWHQLRYVTVPMLRPTVLFSLVVTTIGYLQMFEESYVLTQGGPLHKTQSVSMEIYEKFGVGEYGYAAAIGYVLFAVMAVLAAIQFRLMREKD
jgi:multiple sugar transport system permease protein